jgi:hypothetical protein
MTDSSTAISAAPLIAVVQPYVIAIAGVIIPAVLGWALNELRKLTGIQVQQAAVDKLNALIEDKVGAAVAAASDNLATRSIPVGSPLIADIAKQVLIAEPELAKQLSLQPGDVASMVAGEIGSWQASMTRVSPPIILPPPAKP